MMSNKEFRKTFLIQILLAMTDSFAFGFMYLHFLNIGFGISQILGAVTISLAVPIAITAVMTKLRTKLSFAVAFLAKMLCYVLVLYIVKCNSILLILMISALIFSFFWVPYNVEFFSYATKHTKAFSGGIMVAIYPLIGLFIPIIGGWVFHNYGFKTNLYIAIGVLALGIVYIAFNKSIKTHSIEYKLSEVVKSLKRLKTLFFLQGVGEGAAFIGLPVFTLLFITSELNLGFFYSYLGLFSVIATLILTKLSDKSKKRTHFIYPIVILSAFTTIALGFANTTFTWILFTGLLEFFLILQIPFLIAIPLDVNIDPVKLWAGREMLLNMGRVVGGLILFAGYNVFGDHRPGFLVLGTIFLLFPLVLKMKKIYPKTKNIMPGQHVE